VLPNDSAQVDDNHAHDLGRSAPNRTGDGLDGPGLIDQGRGTTDDQSPASLNRPVWKRL